MPVPITGNFGMGLPLSDYWVSLYAARAGAMDRQLQTEKPGTFNKYMMASLVTNLVTEDDCEDSKGLHFDLKRTGVTEEVQDRYLAADVVKNGKVLAKRNEVITPVLVADLKKHGVSDLQVRSPLTCTTPHGICAKDYGLHDDGSKPTIGDNVGALSGQALSEPLTQLTMQTFHSGGVAGSGIKLSTFDKIDKILRMQKKLPGQARLSDVSGRVDKIEPSATKGGHNVYIDGVEHFVDKRTPLLDGIRAGTHVERGDAISKGIINPNDLVARKGMLPAMEYTAKEIANTYREQGIPLRQRAVETVVRALGSLTKIVDPGDSHYAPDDFVSYNLVEKFNRTALGKKPLDEAEGVLAIDHGEVKAGTKITPHVRKMLERLGHREVQFGPAPIVHQPQLIGIKRLPLARSDWMAQMGYGHIAKAIQEGAAGRTESDIHSYSPIPAFAYGAQFGQGEAGAY
jgi:DNA-directed RNA polymerase subunit beta'